MLGVVVITIIISLPECCTLRNKLCDKFKKLKSWQVGKPIVDKAKTIESEQKS